jgi:hypothetical protein
MLDRGFLQGLALGVIVMYANMQMFMLKQASLPQSPMTIPDAPTQPVPEHTEHIPEKEVVVQHHNTTKNADTTPKIPHRIIITHKYKTLEDIPEPYLSNVKHTIQQYERLWNEMEVWYLNDDDCQIVIERADIRLLKYFWFETRGMYKSDMCRYAAL